MMEAVWCTYEWSRGDAVLVAAVVDNVVASVCEMSQHMTRSQWTDSGSPQST